MKRFLLISLFAALLAAGCSDMETPDDPDNNPPTDQNPSDDNNNPSDEGGCVIYYTTTDDKIAIFVMNGKIVTNNTYENEIGTIKLSTPITVFGNISAEFASNHNLKSVSIPDCVTRIASYALEHADSLESVTLPNSITSIGSAAFGGCHRLMSINIPDNVTTIDSWAFSSCFSLTSIDIPDSVTTIGPLAFVGCVNLKSITIGKGVKTIGAEAFGGCGLDSDGCTIYCHSIVPPKLESEYTHPYDEQLNSNLPPFRYDDIISIYVPTGSVEAYKRADIWSELSDKIVGYNF